MRVSEDWLKSYEARHNNVVKPPSKSEEKEEELHADILSECKRRGWLAFHGSMAHKTHRTPGEPDFIILAEFGTVFFIECKAAARKPSDDQLGVIAWAKKLGHSVHVVWSFEEFLTIVNKPNP